jgi:hypothetical protein
VHAPHPGPKLQLVSSRFTSPTPLLTILYLSDEDLKVEHSQGKKKQTKANLVQKARQAEENDYGVLLSTCYLHNHD